MNQSHWIVSYRIALDEPNIVLNRIGTMESDTYRIVVKTYRYTPTLFSLTPLSLFSHSIAHSTIAALSLSLPPSLVEPRRPTPAVFTNSSRQRLHIIPSTGHWVLSSSKDDSHGCPALWLCTAVAVYSQMPTQGLWPRTCCNFRVNIQTWQSICSQSATCGLFISLVIFHSDWF